jgi:hypothetical protein
MFLMVFGVLILMGIKVNRFKIRKNSFLEKKVVDFFNCGWLLNKSKKSGIYVVVTPSGNAYTLDDFSGKKPLTFLDYSFMNERSSAQEILKMVNKREDFEKEYGKYIKKIA